MSNMPDYWGAASGMGAGTVDRWGEDASPETNWEPEKDTRIAHRVLAWIIAGLTLGYLLPWALAVQTSYPRHKSLLLVNATLGWTGIGWILALIEVLLWRPTSYWEQIGVSRTSST